MLSLPEKLVFVILVIFSLYLTWHSFKRVVDVVRRGGGRLYLNRLPDRVWRAIEVTVTQRTVLSARPITSLFHVAIVWGFLFYALVNLGDVLTGFLPDFQFLGDAAIGNLYRLLADVLSIGVIVGMIYFLVRRFLTPAPELQYHDNILLYPKAKAGGIRRDSAIVGAFILGHVGGRFLGQTFAIAQHGTDPWQPFASAAAAIWNGANPELITLGEHAMW